MIKTRAIILGAGYRGRAYAEYALAHPDRLEVIAVADKINAEAIAASLYFDDWRDALNAHPPAELVIVALPDALHYEATMMALEHGYHVLCEKPLVRSIAEATELMSAQARASRLVMVAHELRYSAYFSRIKEIIDKGAIGKIATISQHESVGFCKAAHSFVRGSLNNAAKSTPLLLSKCSHDIDLFLWWTKGKKVIDYSSFAALEYFKKENAPEDATEFCRDCPHFDDCVWSSKKQYVGSEELRYLFADKSDEAMEKLANEAPYGRCVWKSDNDVADRQTVIIAFEDGIVATLVISAFTCDNCRRTLITGTEGEIIGDGSEITVRRFDGKIVETDMKVEVNTSRHDGGDFNLITETLRMIELGGPEEFGEILSEALRGHLLALAIEDKRCAASR